MPAELVLIPEVSDDLNAAYGWYEARRAGLGEEFLDCVNACLKDLCQSPMIEATIYRSYRRAIVRRFPYGIYDRFADGVVTVFFVSHNARNPNKWQLRLP